MKSLLKKNVFPAALLILLSKAPVHAKVEEPISDSFRAHSIVFSPIVSYYVGGFSGRYEHRFEASRFGFGIPFNLGYNRGYYNEKFYLVGIGASLYNFVSATPKGAFITLEVFLQNYYADIPTDSNQIIYIGDDYPEQASSIRTTLLWNYRWVYTPNHFFVELGLGISYYPLKKSNSSFYKSYDYNLVGFPTSQVTPKMDVQFGYSFGFD